MNQPAELFFPCDMIKMEMTVEVCMGEQNMHMYLVVRGGVGLVCEVIVEYTGFDQ